jgi:hypothetical protein
MSTRLNTIIWLFALAGAPSFAQTCERLHNCPVRQAETRRPEPEAERRRPEPESEDRPERPARNFAPENRPGNNVEQPANRSFNVPPENRANFGESHPNVTVVRPAVVTPAMAHAMTYNTRLGGVRINPDYFATHYGSAHGFHFARYAGGVCVGDCGLRLVGAEWYVDFDGGWFGIMGQMPNWGFQTDYLYIDIGEDGNYYLYDAQFPGVAIQLTFVQNIGDDQAGTDQD